MRLCNLWGKIYPHCPNVYTENILFYYSFIRSSKYPNMWVNKGWRKKGSAIQWRGINCYELHRRGLIIANIPLWIPTCDANCTRRHQPFNGVELFGCGKYLQPGVIQEGRENFLSKDLLLHNCSFNPRYNLLWFLKDERSLNANHRDIRKLIHWVPSMRSFLQRFFGLGKYPNFGFIYKIQRNRI